MAVPLQVMLSLCTLFGSLLRSDRRPELVIKEHPTSLGSPLKRLDFKPVVSHFIEILSTSNRF